MLSKDTFTKYDAKKFSVVLHYIISECGTVDNIGKTVIWKMLYFSDFDFYEQYEKFMTGEDYYKLERGPAPKHFDLTVTALERAGVIQQIKAKFKGFNQTKYLSLKEPNLSLLSAEELKIIDRTIQKLSAMSATQVSGYSHLDTPWKATKDKERIEYELVFYRDEATSVREYEIDDVPS